MNQKVIHCIKNWACIHLFIAFSAWMMFPAGAAGSTAIAKALLLSTNTVDRWDLRPDLSFGRGDPGVVAYNGKIYVLSGFKTGTTGYWYSTEVYDPLTKTWQILSLDQEKIPQPRADFATAVVGGKIYAIGGYMIDTDPEPDVGVVLDRNDVFDPVLGTWSTAADLPVAVSGASGVVLDGKIYVIGGHDGTTSTNEVQIYDPALNSWSTGTPMRVDRSQLGAVVLDGLIYAVGGQATTNAADDVEIFDPLSNTWSDGEAMPGRRFALGVAARLGKLYAVGGFDDRSYDHSMDTTFVFDPATGLWITEDPMPTPRGACRAAVIDDYIYVIGGVGGTGSGTANEIFGQFPGPVFLPIIIKS